MAAKEYEVVTPGRYGTRMLQAGDRIELTQPRGRVYMALGRVKPAPAPKKLVADPELAEDLEAAIPAKPVARKPAAKPRKKAAAKK